MTDLKDSNGNAPLPGQTNILEVIKDRKKWNRSITNFNEDVERCPHCNGPMEESMQADEVNGVEYFSVCKNPDCPKNNY